MSLKSFASKALAAGFVLAPSAAFAHAGHDAAGGFAHGFMHPVGGLDHVLAMVMVGLLAARIGGRAVFAVPASFVAMMIAGGFIGMSGLALPMGEAGIAASVLVLGALLAFAVAPSVAAAMALTGFFALFHGFAHGAEMPAAASAISYAAGFVGATALLHACGIALAMAFDRLAGRAATRIAGFAGALAGVALLGGLI